MSYHKKRKEVKMTNLVPKPNIITSLKQGTNYKPKLLILRGAPGCGKSTIAKIMFPTWKSVSVDDFFTKPDDSYQFNIKFLQTARSNCLDKTRIYLQEGHNVVVHNTFKTLEELVHYASLKELADIRIYHVISQFRFRHNIPEGLIDKHIREYEPCKVEKEVKLDLENKKLIFCENNNYDLPILRLSPTQISDIESDTVKVDVSATGSYIFHNSSQFKFNYDDYYTIEYYQKPKGINIITAVHNFKNNIQKTENFLVSC